MGDDGASGDGFLDGGLDELAGTFADNTDAPVHRWFRYQAGFSYELVARLLERFGVGPGDVVLDPFAGVGTTVVEAKKLGATAHGVEVHPFVSWVAERKTDWDVDPAALRRERDELESAAGDAIDERPYEAYLDEDREPAFLYKVFDERKLGELFVLDEAINAFGGDHAGRWRMALVASLREVCSANTVFPYVQPASVKDGTPEPADAFAGALDMVVEDLSAVLDETATAGDSTIHAADARDLDGVPAGAADAVVTSPPYLNNVDYADVTRLELYFLGYAETWGEVTERVRRDLVNSSTVVLAGVPSDVSPRPELPDAVREELSAKQAELRAARDGKDYGGKRYDVMLPAYFNDMYDALSAVYAAMKPDAPFVLVLGDSAPYGVHVPTDRFLGRIAEGVGFDFEALYEIRERGDTWTSIKGTRRHAVDLRESLLALRKPG